MATTEDMMEFSSELDRGFLQTEDIDVDVEYQGEPIIMEDDEEMIEDETGVDPGDDEMVDDATIEDEIIEDVVDYDHNPADTYIVEDEELEDIEEPNLLEPSSETAEVHQVLDSTFDPVPSTLGNELGTPGLAPPDTGQTIVEVQPVDVAADGSGTRGDVEQESGPIDRFATEDFLESKSLPPTTESGVEKHLLNEQQDHTDASRTDTGGLDLAQTSEIVSTTPQEHDPEAKLEGDANDQGNSPGLTAKADGLGLGLDKSGLDEHNTEEYEQEHSTDVHPDIQVAELEQELVKDEYAASSSDTLEGQDAMPQILVHYQDNEINLFPPRHGSHESEMYLLEDESLANEGFVRIMQSCKSVLADSILDTEELELTIPSMGVKIIESASDSATTSLARLVDIYLQLHRNDGVNDPEPLHVFLEARQTVSCRLDYLSKIAAEGKGFSHITTHKDTHLSELSSKATKSKVDDEDSDSETEKGQTDTKATEENLDNHPTGMEDSSEVSTPTHAEVTQDWKEGDQILDFTSPARFGKQTHFDYNNIQGADEISTTEPTADQEVSKSHEPDQSSTHSDRNTQSSGMASNVLAAKKGLDQDQASEQPAVSYRDEGEEAETREEPVEKHFNPSKETEGNNTGSSTVGCMQPEQENDHGETDFQSTNVDNPENDLENKDQEPLPKGGYAERADHEGDEAGLADEEADLENLPAQLADEDYRDEGDFLEQKDEPEDDSDLDPVGDFEDDFGKFDESSAQQFFDDETEGDQSSMPATNTNGAAGAQNTSLEHFSGASGPREDIEETFGEGSVGAEDAAFDAFAEDFEDDAPALAEEPPSPGSLKRSREADDEEAPEESAESQADPKRPRPN